MSQDDPNWRIGAGDLGASEEFRSNHTGKFAVAVDHDEYGPLRSYLAGGKLDVSLQLTWENQLGLCDSERTPDIGETRRVLYKQNAPD